MDTIHNPKTNKFINLKTKTGVGVLRKYVENLSNNTEYNTIIHPITNKKLKTNGKKGVELLEEYTQTGGGYKRFYITERKIGDKHFLQVYMNESLNKLKTINHLTSYFIVDDKFLKNIKQLITEIKKKISKLYENTNFKHKTGLGYATKIFLSEDYRQISDYNYLFEVEGSIFGKISSFKNRKYHVNSQPSPNFPPNVPQITRPESILLEPFITNNTKYHEPPYTSLNLNNIISIISININLNKITLTIGSENIEFNLEVIDEGGFGTVYRVFSETKLQCALKIEYGKNTPNSNILTTNPNLPKDYNIIDMRKIEFNGTSYIFMEYMYGNIYNLLQFGNNHSTYQPDNILQLKILKIILISVYNLYIDNFVYTDLKLENILYKINGNKFIVKLGDIGSICELDNITSPITEGDTLIYIYPESDEFDKSIFFKNQVFIILIILISFELIETKEIQKIELTFINFYNIICSGNRNKSSIRYLIQGLNYIKKNPFTLTQDYIVQFLKELISRVDIDIDSLEKNGTMYV